MRPRPSSGRGRRATNILLTCSDDAGHGGVQVVFRDLVRSLEGAGRRVYLLYAGPTARAPLHTGPISGAMVLVTACASLIHAADAVLR